MSPLLPHSDLYTLQTVPGAGRSVVATCHIPAGTPILSTSPSLSPVAHTVFRLYKREVCGWCFLYDRGRTLSCRSLLVSAGVAFCSSECADCWQANIGALGLEAFLQLEARDRRCSKMREAAAQATIPQGDSQVPSMQQVQDMVHSFQLFGDEAKHARLSEAGRRNSKKTLLKLMLERPELDPDNLRLMLSAILQIRNTILSDFHERRADTVRATEYRGQVDLPSSLLALESDAAVYKDVDALTENMRNYVELVARLPADLLPYVSPLLCHEVLARASHNAFSIRPEGASDGDRSGEYFGWGVWPEASFFNHSCDPSVAKARKGRIWHFTAARDVEPGEHLCITYLGGDEEDLDVRERKTRLREHWHFECQCSRCLREQTELDL